MNNFREGKLAENRAPKRVCVYKVVKIRNKTQISRPSKYVQMFNETSLQ